MLAPNLTRVESLLENFSTVLIGKCNQVLVKCMSEYEIQMYRDVVSTLLEKSLLQINPQLIAQTEKELQRNGLTFNDALENPESVFLVLQKILGSDYSFFVKTMNNEMSLLSQNLLFEKFLDTLNK